MYEAGGQTVEWSIIIVGFFDDKRGSMLLNFLLTIND
jgi:hypothetical protein